MQGAWLGKHCGREPGTGGRSGLGTQGSPLPAPQFPGQALLGSMVKGSLKGPDPKSQSLLILGTQCQEAKGKMKQKLPSDQTNKQTDPEGDTYLQLELQTCRPRRPLDAGRPCPCLSTQPAPFLIHQLASPSPWVGHFPGFWKVLPINPFPARLLGLKISGLSLS